MKIRSIAGCNLNSLKGAFRVDFSSGVLKDCGIFAITGPTGAGKTTLLDAVTLALYGKTPRSATDEDIISYGAIDASAEVIFETPEGCFKSEWKVRRAKKKHDGSLQQSVMEISTHPGGIILTRKKKEAQDKVKALIGLEYDQFLKSVLLAQGAFQAFLDAKESERGAMLEKISDTRLYTNLSKRAFERKKQEELLLEALRTKVGNLILLGKEERLSYIENVQKLDEDSKGMQELLAAAQLKSDWLKTINDLTRNQQAAAEELQKARQRIDEEQPKLKRWETHEQVSTLEVKWRQYNDKVNEGMLEQKKIEQLQVTIDQLSEHLEQASRLQSMAVERMEMAVKDREERMTPLLIAINRQADLLAEQKQLNIRYEKLKAKTQEEADCIASIRQNNSSLADHTAALVSLETWMNEHKHYSGAASNLTQATLLVSELKRSRQDIHLYEADISKAVEQIARAQKEQLDAATDEDQAIEQQRLFVQLKQTNAEQLGRLKAQLSAYLEAHNPKLEELKRTIATKQNELSRKEFLAEHLSRLHEGESCPLCGSTEHPNQTLSISAIQYEIKQYQQLIESHQGEINVSSQKQQTVEKILASLDEYDSPEEISTEQLPQNFQTKLRELVQSVKSLPLKVQEAALASASAGQLKETLATKILDLEKRKKETEDALKSATEVLEQRTIQLKEIALSYGLLLEVGHLHHLTDSLRNYANEYHDKTNEESRLRGAIPGLEASIVTLGTQHSSIIDDLEHLKKEIEDKKELIQKYTDQSAAAYIGFLSPEAARDHITSVERQAVDALNRMNDQFNGMLREKGTTLGEKEYATGNLKGIQLILGSLATDLRTALALLGMEEDIALIGQNLIPGNERQTLGNLYKSVYDKLMLAEASLADCTRLLEFQLARQVTNEDPASVTASIAQLQDVLQQLNQELGRQKQILHEDDAKTERIHFVKKEIEEQEKIAEKWAALSALIGSDNGRKFNQFAQGLTLERLILISNHHLQLLNDRYLLKRNVIEQGLQLHIIDRYQADNEREINTLSGGESFLVSLALALGLSEMTSKLTTIDSLFIDEGFGTLDADTLEVALNALRGLQITGKTIGIISHVERLKEEIYTQVEITKGADGFSTLRVIPETF